MIILNPGSAHFDQADGSALIEYSDYSAPSATVASLDNDPAAVTSD